MNTDRRRLLAALAGAAAGAAATPTHANEPSMPRELVPRGGIDAAALGVRPNSAEDQSKALQRAIESAAATRAVLHLPPGSYRAGDRCSSRPTRRSLARPERRASSCPGGLRCCRRPQATMSPSPALFSTAAASRFPSGAAWCISPRAARVRIADCEIVQCRPQRHYARGDRGGRHRKRRQRRRHRHLLARRARPDALPATRCAAPAMAASWSGAARPATTARSSSTTASRTSTPAPAAPASTATPSTCSAPAT